MRSRAQRRGARRTDQARETNVTVAAIPSADLAGLYIAQDEGLFARQGLHVTITTIASTKAVIASQLNGKVDIGAGSYVGYVAAQAAGAKFRILAEASTLQPHTRVLLTTAGSRITTLAGWPARRSRSTAPAASVPC